MKVKELKELLKDADDDATILRRGDGFDSEEVWEVCDNRITLELMGYLGPDDYITQNDAEADGMETQQVLVVDLNQ